MLSTRVQPGVKPGTSRGQAGDEVAPPPAAQVGEEEPRGERVAGAGGVDDVAPHAGGDAALPVARARVAPLLAEAHGGNLAVAPRKLRFNSPICFNCFYV